MKNLLHYRDAMIVVMAVPTTTCCNDDDDPGKIHDISTAEKGFR